LPFTFSAVTSDASAAAAFAALVLADEPDPDCDVDDPEPLDELPQAVIAIVRHAASSSPPKGRDAAFA
jgi:hypothetical protein